VLGSLARECAEVLVAEDLTQQRLPARTMVAALRQTGLTAQLVHFGHGSEPESVVALACLRQPRLIVLSLLFGHLLSQNVRLAERLRAAGVTAHITMAGPLPAFAHTELLASCHALDSVLMGDPEVSLSQLAAALVRDADCSSQVGLASRTTNTSVAQQDAPTCDLDALPFAARDEGIASYHGVGFATIESSRGCYHTCSFCLPCAYYRTVIRVAYRLRSIPRMVDEIEWLYQRGTRLFLFDDEQFLPPIHARAERVAMLDAELRRRGLDIAFTIKCRPDDVEDGLFQQLKDMGLLRVYLGLESGCQTTLDVLNKQITVDQNTAALVTLDRLGIVADFRCMLFHPWSTFDTLRTEVDFLRAILHLVPTTLSFHEVECFPGTAIHGRMMKDISEDAARRPRERSGRLVPTWSYVLGDPRAELLRRAGQRVFRHCLSGDGIVGQVTQAWYQMLLARRFRPRAVSEASIGGLRGIVRETNAGLLDVWSEMISFAEQADARGVEHACRPTPDWTERVCRLEMRARQEIDWLLDQPGSGLATQGRCMAE
jgi:anaerobic magnesium-protoporphyrin IX monomethyl ester cyclase